MFEIEILEAALPVAAAVGSVRFRDMLPARLRDTIRSLRYDRRILALPDRRFVEDHLAPWIGSRGGNVLFVGCRSYTRHYPDLFARHGARLWTTDIDPAAARFGAPGRHVTADATRLDQNSFGFRFDTVVFSGVIGFGVDSDAQVGQAAEAMARLLAPGAPLVLGWNTDRSDDPLMHSAWHRLFHRMEATPFTERVDFEGATHVFDVLAARR